MEWEALNRRVIACRMCPRLVKWREAAALTKRKSYRDWTYWGKPVPGFGDRRATIMAVGLAPGVHGSNRTGRQFTGDASGRFLYPALFRAGLANQPASEAAGDGLKLHGVYITAACRCAPPANRPAPTELANCRPYLERELDLLNPKVIVCLGHVAFTAIVRIHSLRLADFRFAHGTAFRVDVPVGNLKRWLLCSYHPSQQNTLTGRLTEPMFDAVWRRASELAEDVPS